jgi:hypothetical protein
MPSIPWTTLRGGMASMGEDGIYEDRTISPSMADRPS